MNGTLRRGIDLLSLCLLAGMAAFVAVAVDQLTWAWILAVPAGLLAVAGGLSVERGLGGLPGDDRIDYPFHAAQRARRLAYMGLALTVGAVAFGGLRTFLIETYGRVLVIGAGALAILGPILVLPGLFWVADGIALRLGHESETTPLLVAGAGLALTGALALLATFTLFSIPLSVLAVLGGVVPAVFILWTYRKLATVATGQVDKAPPA